MVMHTHFLASTRPSIHGFQVEDKIGLCGEDSFIYSYYPDIEKVDCPKCSAKWALAEMAKQPRKITLEKASDDDSRGFRSVYMVLIDGQRYGYVTLEGGKRARWELRDNGRNRPSTEVPFKNNPDRTFTKEIIPSRKSKEHAALDILAHIEHFSNRDEWLAEIAARNSEYAKRRDEAKKARDQENADYDMAIEVLTEMRQRAGTTNEEAYALEVALKALGNVRAIGL